jgi:hypothetical protein
MSFEARHSEKKELDRKRNFNIEVVTWLLESGLARKDPEILTKLPAIFGWSVFPSHHYRRDIEKELSETKEIAKSLLEVIQGTRYEELVLLAQIKERNEIITDQTIFSELFKSLELKPSEDLKSAIRTALGNILRNNRVRKDKAEGYLKDNGYLDRWPWLQPSSVVY